MSSITRTNWLLSWSTVEWWHAGTRIGARSRELA